MTTIEMLRFLIREEISHRSKATGQSTDAYPWVTSDERVSIYPNVEDEGGALAVVQFLDDDDSVEKSFPDYEEASFWAAGEVSKRKRERFSKEK
jgi:hypothetical protein